MESTHTKHKIHLDNATRGAVKQFQERHPLGTISSVVAQLAHDAVHPVTGADRARQFLKQANGDHAIANGLMLQYLHLKYRNFNCNRQPGKREYDRIRKSLNTLSKT